ncbi:MAG: hypothetical protein H6619_03180 [Deltaproteobacteria bacterium]|nr:hypothetical protein [Deltaproteobacteria bacterium]
MKFFVAATYDSDRCELTFPHGLGADTPLVVGTGFRRVRQLSSANCPEPQICVRPDEEAQEVTVELSNAQSGAHKKLVFQVGAGGSLTLVAQVNNEGERLTECRWPDTLVDWRHDDEQWPIIHPPRPAKAW